MTRRELTMTTVGLSVRDEMLVKSFLQVVRGSTADSWRYLDDLHADLALCDPASALSRVALQTQARAGRPVCVGFLRDAQRADTFARTIRAPLRVGEFVSLLDTAIGADGTTSARAPAASAGPHPTGRGLVAALRDALAQASEAGEGAWRIETPQFVVHLLQPDATYVAARPWTDESIVPFVREAAAPTVTRLTREQAAALRANATPRPLVELLWHCGLHASPDALLPWLPATARLRLRQWPDFGRLGGQRQHFALAATLAREPHDAAGLARATGQPRGTVLAFLNACALCDLLEVVPSPAAPASARPATGPLTALFRNLRSALRIGE